MLPANSPLTVPCLQFVPGNTAAAVSKAPTQNPSLKPESQKQEQNPHIHSRLSLSCSTFHTKPAVVPGALPGQWPPWRPTMRTRTWSARPRVAATAPRVCAYATRTTRVSPARERCAPTTARGTVSASPRCSSPTTPTQCEFFLSPFLSVFGCFVFVRLFFFPFVTRQILRDCQQPTCGISSPLVVSSTSCPQILEPLSAAHPGRPQ